MTEPDTDRTVLVFDADAKRTGIPSLGQFIAGLQKWSYLGKMHPKDDVVWWCEIPKPPAAE